MDASTDEKIRAVILGNGPDALDSYVCTVPKEAGVSLERAVKHAVQELALHSEGTAKVEYLWVMFALDKKGRPVYHCADTAMRVRCKAWIQEVLQ